MKVEDVFNKEFWISQWGKDKDKDTYKVHKGFSTSEYWDKAAVTYNRDKKEIQDRRLEKSMRFLSEKGLVFEGMQVLDIGCGTGLLSLELARHGAIVTALDFSPKMLERVQEEITPDIKEKVTLVCEDFFTTNINDNGWYKKFDLVIAFMSPGVATPDALFKMMDCSKNGCAIRGWAQKKPHPFLSDLWEKIMKAPLEDKPQSVLYKINLLFSMGMFPDVCFDTIEWTQKLKLEEELNNQVAFFNRVSNMSEKDLKPIILNYLKQFIKEGILVKKQKGLTATAVWKLDKTL